MDVALIDRWKFAYTTRRVDHGAIAAVVAEHQVPEAGDLILAEVLELGQHRRIELVDGRRASLFPGDRIGLCYGNRYAPAQFQAPGPASLEPCHLAPAAGAAPRAEIQHAHRQQATPIPPIGPLHDAAGRRM